MLIVKITLNYIDTVEFSWMRMVVDLRIANPHDSGIRQQKLPKVRT